MTRTLLHPAPAAGLLLAAAAGGVAWAAAGSAWAVALLAAVLGAAAGFANSGST